ncbi:4Fe-4S binding protein [Methanospirillum sp. J.3.6.1-F.2.7.3]|uniref:4Fe-4S binding protein n=1 Tax=Methanospirillum purgamenti TaxID=2834276 RepID=A0A8E7B1V8_9EURY|nr:MULTISPECIES: 4Fe-4S binding protein [Methanospirillum]MDX8549224.1 4Fe-4S binding protein [Methanospirillum hungatei]NLW75432.1 4Fe-4S binding protein [Methanomicrobiales archaeon]QVV88892.1 4Fe-4S binding protein [Methanospirillum sp. J.3.6.1-F.2.7.3]
MAARDRLAISKPREGACGNTGTWRVFRPVVDKGICNSCGMCAMYCPDGVINDDYEIDLVFCKGCGICAAECPKKAITMVREDNTTGN